ncbi:MAG TPA: ABC transporter substrate-binding protein [Methylomirabilota bacterium]|nr:ABC transporter substrate-binding protein [Methylomirabilota bacterium]
MKHILGALLGIFVLHFSVEAADKIKMGFPDPSSSFLSLPVGQKAGFFPKEGIQAEFIRIRSTIALTALISGEIDYHSVIAPGIAAAIRGVPVRVVACYTPSIAAAIVARPEFKSIQDLRGKTIGLNSFGGGLESTARLMFKHLGLDPDKDVKFLATGGIESRLLALKQGLTAATLGSPPADFLGKKMGFIVLARAYELFSYPSSGLVVSVNRIKERPDEIKRVIKAGIRTNRYISQNREGTIVAMTQWMKIDREMAADTYDSVVKTYSDDLSLPEDGLRLLIDEAKRAAKMEHDVSLNQIVDFSILREAQREMGIKAK